MQPAGPLGPLRISWDGLGALENPRDKSEPATALWIWLSHPRLGEPSMLPKTPLPRQALFLALFPSPALLSCLFVFTQHWFPP